MNLVCFSNNTAGGLICDLLNNVALTHKGYHTTGFAHSMFKIGDTPNIQTTVDIDEWNRRIQLFKSVTFWIGTHCHPIGIPDLSVFEKIICITTVTRQSKLLRWLRYFHGWYKKFNPNFVENDLLPTIDEVRELCKNVFITYEPHTACLNVEFESIVDGSFIKQHNLNQSEFKKWQVQNDFLYQYSDHDWAVKRFNEAEYEILNKTPFRYF